MALSRGRQWAVGGEVGKGQFIYYLSYCAVNKIKKQWKHKIEQNKFVKIGASSKHDKTNPNPSDVNPYVDGNLRTVDMEQWPSSGERSVNDTAGEQLCMTRADRIRSLTDVGGQGN